MEEQRLVDLSHVIEDGMTTYKGLPGPHICDFWKREHRRQLRRRLDLPDRPDRHGRQYRHLSRRALPPLCGRRRPRRAGARSRSPTCPGMVVRRPWENGSRSTPARSTASTSRGKAVLVHTGWDRHWRTDAYSATSVSDRRRGRLLAEHGAALVGIDSYNIDDTHVRARPVHTILLGAGIPICEHMTDLGSAARRGFRFTAVPPKSRGHGHLSRCAPSPCSAERAPRQPVGHDRIAGDRIDAGDERRTSPSSG